MFEIEIITTKETKKMLRDQPDDWRDALIKGVKHSILFAEGEAKKSFGKTGNLKVRSGHLRRSIKSSVRERLNQITGILSNDVVYAGIHEYGGVILPKRGKYLTFKVGDRWAKVTKVTIPPRPFLEPAIEDNLKKLSDIITNTIFKEFNKE